jgi:hypothetical protein
MTRIIARPDPSQGRDAQSSPQQNIYPVDPAGERAVSRHARTGAGMSGTHALSRRQIRCIEELPEGHTIVSVSDGVPIVRRPDGQLSRMQPSGRLVAATRVEMVQSYLHVHG